MAVHTGTQFVRAAASFIGTPYVYGGSSPRGFDCSGLIYYVLGKMGISAPRTSSAQYHWTKRVPVASLKPGDLVFLNFPGESPSPGHVMIWLGANRVLQAPSSGQRVRVSHFDPQRPGTNEWGATVIGYGRIPGLSYAGEPPSVSAGGDGGGGGITGAVGGAVGGVAHDIASPFEGAASAASGTAHFLGELTSAQFWLRALEIVGGGLILMLGLYLLAKQVGMGDEVPAPATPGLSPEALAELKEPPGIASHRPAYRRSTEGVKRGKVTRHEVSEAGQRRQEIKRRSELAKPSDDVPF